MLYVKYYTNGNSLYPQEPYNMCCFTIIISLVSKLRHREVEQLSLGYIAIWWEQDLNLGSWAPKSDL